MPTETRTPLTRDGSLTSLIAAQPRDSLALAASSYRLSYGQLNECSAALAQGLQLLGVGPDIPIGVFTNRTPAGVIGALAVMKAGGCYVPLDPANPPDRLHFMLRDVRPPFVLAERAVANRLPKGPWKVIPIDESAPLFAKPTEPSVSAGPNRLAYISYTSGSTGRPHGVEITHGALMNLIRWHQRVFKVTSADNASQMAASGFDAAVWEMWPYLTAGASLHFPDERISRVPATFSEWLVDDYITMAFAPTSLAEQLIALPWPRPGVLRYLLTGGDVLRHCPRPGLPFTLVNNYGPTEAAVVATSGAVSPQSMPGPPASIGRPIDNVRVTILNESQQPVRDGVVGELYIGGAGLARGYVNQPELTAARFIPDLSSPDPNARLYRTGDLARRMPDGQIAFAGRLDDQIKIRGYRVEPAEIESALNAYPAVQNSVAMAREDTPGDRRLVAYVVAPGDAAPSAADLMAWLRDRLPAYMVPDAIVNLEEFPLNANGKVDRSALPAPQLDSETAVRKEIEARLAQVVASILEVDHIANDQNFFSVGEPIMRALLLDRIHQIFGVELTPRQLFDAPTISALAGEIDRAAMLCRSSK